jgi:hypothetical protein
MAFDQLLEVLQAVVQSYETAMCANCFTIFATGETKLSAPGLMAAKGKQNMKGRVSEVWVFVIWGLIPVAMMFAGVVIQWFRTQERLRLIEKGVPISELPPAWPSRRALNPWEFAANFRLAGIINVAVGLGLLILFTTLAETLPQFPKGVIAVSTIPFLVGLGLLLEYRLRRKEIEARERSDGGAGRG